MDSVEHGYLGTFARGVGMPLRMKVTTAHQQTQCALLQHNSVNPAQMIIIYTFPYHLFTLSPAHNVLL